VREGEAKRTTHAHLLTAEWLTCAIAKVPNGGTAQATERLRADWALVISFVTYVVACPVWAVYPCGWAAPYGTGLGHCRFAVMYNSFGSRVTHEPARVWLVKNRVKLLARLVTHFKRIEPSRVTNESSRASYRAPSFLSSPR
jgi:hypothetical protein